MRLIIDGFRIYKDKTSLDFKPGIVKITGDSGAGKTTIFHAIEWCLYGKTRKIKPLGHTGKTYVSLSMNMPVCPILRRYTDKDTIDIKAERESSRIVRLTLGDKIYQDHDAQSMIDLIFGDSNLFRVTSYLRAEEMHPMLVATPAEKREITSNLFPDAAKHQIYKDKISGIKNRMTSSLNGLDVKLAKLDGIISTTEEHHSWVTTDTSTTEVPDLDALKKYIQDMKAKYENEGKIAHRYRAYKDEVSSIPEVKDLSDQEEERASIRERLQQSVVDVTAREAKISSIRERLDSIDLDGVPSLTECQQAYSDCMSITATGMEKFDSSEISSMEEELSKLRNYHSQGYTCPSCAVSLVLSGDSLIEGTANSDVDPSKKIHTLEMRLSSLKKVIKNYPSYENIDIKKKMDEMNRLVSMHQEHNRLTSQLNKIPEVPETYLTPDDSTEMKRRLSSLDTTISKNMSNKDRIAHITSAMKKIEESHPNIDNEEYLPSILADIEKEESNLESHIKNKRMADIKKRYTDSISARKKILSTREDTSTRIDACLRLATIIDEVYNHYVGTLLKSIEHDISHLAKLMFDSTMNISLLPSKTTASGITKPSFDMRIQYNGIEYDDVRSMSTGEKKRLSLILMIVLTKHTDGRIMLLDEALTSVGMEQRGPIMNEIGRLGIPVAITSHDDVPGGYDYDMNIG